MEGTHVEAPASAANEPEDAATEVVESRQSGRHPSRRDVAPRDRDAKTSLRFVKRPASAFETQARRASRGAEPFGEIQRDATERAPNL
jgi:hypothetical protein